MADFLGIRGLNGRQHRSATLPALDLSRHPEAKVLHVRPHDLETYETYDELAHLRDEDFLDGNGPHRAFVIYLRYACIELDMTLSACSPFAIL